MSLAVSQMQASTWGQMSNTALCFHSVANAEACHTLTVPFADFCVVIFTAMLQWNFAADGLES